MARVEDLAPKRSSPKLAILLLAALVVPQPLLAATLAGVTLPDQIEVAHRRLVLNGLGLRKATIFGIKVYLAGLYLESRCSDASQIMRSTQRKRLVLHFLRAASRTQIAAAWRQGLRKNVQDTRPLEGRLAELSAAIPDVKKGDRIIFDFADGSVDVEVVGGARKSVRGADFAAAMLGIWFGPKAPRDDLQAGMLGK
jgi:Chalcone isomerase-like